MLSLICHVLLLLDYSDHRGRDRMVAHVLLLLDYSDHRGRDRMVPGFTISYAISWHHH